MAKPDHLPKYNELLNPLLQALHDLGGSGTIGDISSTVSELYLCRIQGFKKAHGDNFIKLNCFPYITILSTCQVIYLLMDVPCFKGK